MDKALKASDIERAGRFRIGDAVTINQDSPKDWVGDWVRTEATIWGIAIDRHDKVNITILHDGDQVTDGFEPEDFVLLRSSGTGRSEAEAKELRHYAERVGFAGDMGVIDRQFGFVRCVLPYDYRYTSNSQQHDEAEKICRALEGPMQALGVMSVQPAGRSALSQPAKGEDETPQPARGREESDG